MTASISFCRAERTCTMPLIFMYRLGIQGHSTDASESISNADCSIRTRSSRIMFDKSMDERP
ncbi:hypothetical protein AG1IA_03859 [Rhizoctonia solani AG-1 IA]|uniref:Uncharacterized protein n=1 Tax=Thanatephorus cucumeris (strain AG1-IA) TaxID=983506 RepID=L8WZA6_THACA|nr:hypothetical protein AG1IA_03859 [Rhizoctonia solani AG-1 IA]